MNITKQLAEQLLEHRGMPLYVYFQEVIESRIQELQHTVGAYANTQFLYAVKTNFNPHIVKIIIQNGFGIDAVSVEEVKMGILCGANRKIKKIDNIFIILYSKSTV